MSNSLEDILFRLLVPDNTVLIQATNELKNVYQSPEFISHLVSTLTTSNNIQVRQYSAILLRQKVSKNKQWNKFSKEIKDGLKQSLLQLLFSEPQKSVKNSVAQVIGIIAKHELPKNQWPELISFLNGLTTSINEKDRQLGLYTFNSVASFASEELKPHISSLMTLFSKTLNDTDPFVATMTIYTLTYLVPCIGTDDMKKFQALIPPVIEVIKKLIITNQADASQALDIFEELMESEVAILVPQMKPLVIMCLEIAANKSLEDNLRVKSLSVISHMMRLKKKTILKHNLVPTILDVIFPLMCQPSPNELLSNQDQDHEPDEDDQTPALFAPQVLDVMSLHLPPEKLIPPLMKHLEPALLSNSPYPKKAGYTTIAVMAEGCSEYIRHKHLHTFLQLICKGMLDQSNLVRNAALFAMGQFSEYLQPDISKFHADLMPVMLQYLSSLCSQLQQGNKDPPNLTGVFFALETFCENLDEQLLPYLPSLMDQLVLYLTTTNSIEPKELAISAIGACANAAKGAMVPYFPQVIEILKQYLLTEHTDATMPLLTQAVDTLGVFARTIGSATFLPMAKDCICMGLELVDKVHDPDLRRCVYGLFASISLVLGPDMASFMPSIIDHMLDSLMSTEGIVPHFNEKDGAFTLFEGLDDENAEEDLEESEDLDDEENEAFGHSIENSYLEEKEDTCCALREIASNVGQVFLPYFERSYDEVSKLLDHPAPDVRKPAISAIGQFCITLHKSVVATQSVEQSNVLDQAIRGLLPKLLLICSEDKERLVVLSSLETLGDMFKEMGQLLLDNTTLEVVVVLVKNTFKHKLACQDECDSGEEDEDQEAEYDGMLLEYAGELVPAIAKSLSSEHILPFLENVLPCLLSKTNPKCSVAERSFSVGTLAETVSALGPGAVGQLVKPLLPQFLSAMKDEDPEVRSNAVYGLGVLVQNAGDILLSQFPHILQALSTMLVKENDQRSRDNIVSAVARLINTDSSVIPLSQVLPVFLKCLPLEVDFDETSTVYSCIYNLYSKRIKEFFECLPQVLRIISQELQLKNVSDETRAKLVEIVQKSFSEFPNEFQALMPTLPQSGQDILKSLIHLSSS